MLIKFRIRIAQWLLCLFMHSDENALELWCFNYFLSNCSYVNYIRPFDKSAQLKYLLISRLKHMLWGVSEHTIEMSEPMNKTIFTILRLICMLYLCNHVFLSLSWCKIEIIHRRRFC